MASAPLKLSQQAVFFCQAPNFWATASAGSFSKVLVATLFGSPTASSTAAALQAAAPFLPPKEIPSIDTNLAGTSHLPTEKRQIVPANSISQPQITRSLPNIILPPPLEIQRYSTLESPRMSPCEVLF